MTPKSLKSQDAGSPVTHEHSRPRAELHPGPAASVRLSIESGHPVTADVAPVSGDAVRFIAADGRCMFEVRAGKDGRSIEVRGVETTRVLGVLYDSTLLVQPCASNSVNITTKEYGK